jgi:uncharacterized protein YkwD
MARRSGHTSQTVPLAIFWDLASWHDASRMSRLHSTLLCFALALVVTQVSADVAVGRTSSPTVRERVFELINHARSRTRRCGQERFAATVSLVPSSLLNRAAQEHALDMARNDYFEHTGMDGSEPKERLARLGYRSRLTGENIAYGPETAEEVVSGWLSSPGHCANIMDPRFREMGIAFAVAPVRGAIYWVQDLAVPRR